MENSPKADKKIIMKDIFVGIIIAAVSIPIGMGYAQIAGLPAVYGLYGSVLPIILFYFITSSPQFIIGVDAAPAALIGAALITLNIEPRTDAALSMIAVLTMYTGIWLLLFYIFKADRLLNFISQPVMGGFITGIGATIILMQIPKLLGSQAGHGEFFELAEAIIKACGNINYISLAMGCASLFIILVSKKINPKFPMSIVVMILGALSTKIFHVDNYNVALLDDVARGLPKFVIPDFTVISFSNGVMLSLPIAIVILAESLLSETTFAQKNGYKINDRREILGFTAANISAALIGCCPINGSVSRTSLSEQYGAKTKTVSLTAGIVMGILLISYTGFIKYLPVPVLTAIVISALMGVLEIHVAKKLYKVNKAEFMIFMSAFAAVLFLGTIYGVCIGLFLSFAVTVIKSSKPTTGFLGVIGGQIGFFDLKRNKNAKKIKGTVIYRFDSSLFFGNINTFIDDIENALTEDTKVVIVDAGAISTIDFTAAERLKDLYKFLKDRNIKFHITEHIGELNDEFKQYGLNEFLVNGVVRRKIRLALKEEGIVFPYPLEEGGNYLDAAAQNTNVIEEFEWAFGENAESQMEKHTEEIIKNLKKVEGILEPTAKLIMEVDYWKHLGHYDKYKLMEHLEMHLKEIAESLGQTEDAVEANIINYRMHLSEKMKEEDGEFYEKYIQKRHQFEETMKKNNSAVYNFVLERRKRQYENLKKTDPETADKMRKLIEFEHQAERKMDEEIFSEDDKKDNKLKE